LSEDAQHDRSERRSLVRALSLAVLALAGLVFVASTPPASRDLVLQLWQGLLDAPAAVFFSFLAVALLLPIPASVLYVAAGPIFGVVPSLVWIAPALAVNALLVHAIGTTAVRPRMIAWIDRRGLRIPTLDDPSDQLLFATVVRVTPGIPYFVQSWTIVLAGIRRDVFVVISVGIQMVYATGFVLLGRSAFEGRTGLAVTALAFLLVAGLVARHVHRRLRDRAPALDEVRD
jgi:uncharacterized membrane protein YdjX (TVP38/TMEM64 family)